MKRGIIRITAGIIMVSLQLFAIIGSLSSHTITDTGVWFNVGYYSVGIIGVVLLIYGSRAYRNGLYSKLVLHRNSEKIHSVIKWVGFALSTFLFVLYLMSCLSYKAGFCVFDIMMVFGTLSYSVYSLFYMYKKPSCLFSATLIFTGIAYIYGVIEDLPSYIIRLAGTSDYTVYMILGVIPRFVAGVLYIFVATKLYREDFSVNVIKTLGWAAFVSEMLNRVLGSMLLLGSLFFVDIVNLIYILFVTVLMLYISVFEISTLQGMPVIGGMNNTRYGYQGGPQNNSDPAIRFGWKCSCGRIHPQYETSCVCGKSKFDKIEQSKPDEAIADKVDGSFSTTEQVRVCRRCGKRLVKDSRFCSGCGTEIVKM